MCEANLICILGFLQLFSELLLGELHHGPLGFVLVTRGTFAIVCGSRHKFAHLFFDVCNGSVDLSDAVGEEVGFMQGHNMQTKKDGDLRIGTRYYPQYPSTPRCSKVCEMGGI